MRVFVTGATGFIGSAVVAELLRDGHEVVGLARSDAAASSLTAAGAIPHRGTIEDLTSLRTGAAGADGAVHTAFFHQFSHAGLRTRLRVVLGGSPRAIAPRFMRAMLDTDRRAIETIGRALGGQDRPIVAAFGTLALTPGRLGTEEDDVDPDSAGGPRGAAEDSMRQLAAEGVRTAVVRLPPIVHGDGDHGFLAQMIAAARKHQVVSYPGDGQNRWPSVHRLDAAHLFVRALEDGQPGSATTEWRRRVSRCWTSPLPSPPSSTCPPRRRPPSRSRRGSASWPPSSGSTTRPPARSPAPGSTGSRPTGRCSTTWRTAATSAQPLDAEASSPGHRCRHVAARQVGERSRQSEPDHDHDQRRCRSWRGLLIIVPGRTVSSVPASSRTAARSVIDMSPSLHRLLTPPIILVLLAAVSASTPAAAAPGTPSAGQAGTTVTATSTRAPARSADDPIDRVLAISVDGLNPRAIRDLGPEGAPAFHRLMGEGAYTLNARTAREQTRTLPNHTGMLTGRRVDARQHGHGVIANHDTGSTVHRAAGHYTSSVFDVVHDRGGRTALFTTKAKFALFDRSWSANGAADEVGVSQGRDKIDRFTVDTDDTRLVGSLTGYLRSSAGQFTFLHVSLPDEVGHEHGFMSSKYVAAVKRTDQLLGSVLDTVAASPSLRRDTLVLVTADHGGDGASHSDPDKLANYRVPFLAWGPGVAAGQNLYRLNPSRRSPGSTRTTYSGRQPVRNGDLANLATDVLDLPRVPSSEFDADRELTLFG